MTHFPSLPRLSASRQSNPAGNVTPFTCSFTNSRPITRRAFAASRPPLASRVHDGHILPQDRLGQPFGAGLFRGIA